jgi:glycerophosphoryl diester phosphodiesterase
MSNTKIYAHRGGPLRAPENTIKAFKTAMADGASAIECDIRRTLDGQFAAFHDRTLERVSGLDWAVERTAWGHLKASRNAGEPPAHLDDILNLMILHPGLEVFFEMILNSPAEAADLAREISKAGVESRARLLVFSPYAGQLREARLAVPAIGAAVIPLFPSNLARSAEKAGAAYICPGWIDWPFTRQLFMAGAAIFDLKAQAAAAAEKGIEVSVGVANTPREVRWLASQGVHAVWTDDVPMALKYV